MESKLTKEIFGSPKNHSIRYSKMLRDKKVCDAGRTFGNIHFEDSLEVLESRRQVGEDRSSSGALALRP